MRAIPITVTAEVSGIGNFDQLEAPAIAESQAGRLTPRASSSSPIDDVGHLRRENV